LTEAARPLLRGDFKLLLARPRVRVVPAKKAAARGAASREGDPELFEALRRLRKEIADRDAVPPFVVFTDAALAEMSAEKPRDEASFLEINGVGQVKLERYGREFLDLIRSFA
jgi:ATP-dependent DNA helicase RecQ